MGPNNFVAQLRYLPRRMLTRHLLALANFVFYFMHNKVRSGGVH